MDTFRVDSATQSDLGAVSSLIDGAAAWLRTKGTDQWRRPWPSWQGRVARVMDGIESGKTWIAWDGHNAAATITVEDRADPKLWNEWEGAEPAAYVHRLVVNRRYAGLGLGAALLNWAGDRAVDAYGAKSIRIDVWTTNMALHRYYERQGFIFVRECSDLSYPSGALFQRDITRKPPTPGIVLECVHTKG
ncbi:MAG TPA: GNAT family N-acetyltransferase [Streptosporangiaceae bacterium]|nr:GNAT family N-acetyltransferase [Streptosporangiaceae bacterium]